MEHRFEIEKVMNGEQMTLTLRGWLDAQSAPKLEQIIEELEEKVNELVLDFSDLEYISSAGIRQIVSAYKVMVKKGGLMITNIPDEILDVLRMTGLDQKLTIQK